MLFTFSVDWLQCCFAQQHMAAELFFDDFCQLFVHKSRCDRLCRLCSVSFSFVSTLLEDVGIL